MVIFEFHGIAIPYDKFRFKFPGLSEESVFHGESGHDLFVLSALNGKRDGKYLEIGSRHPSNKSNTFILEKDYNWKGLSIEINPSDVELFNASRQNICLQADATMLYYKPILDDMGWSGERIDYLSLDCDPAPQTYMVLERILKSGYIFNVITFEHDEYSQGTDIRDKSRELLRANGYILAIAGVTSPISETLVHEDWWIYNDVPRDVVSDKEQNRMYDYFLRV